MPNSIIINEPKGQTRQLILLFHGMGATPEHMIPLGKALSFAYPQACIVSVRAPNPGGFGVGFEWFSVQGIDDTRRVQRVATAMPGFVKTIWHWQSGTGTGARETALIGFSQGATMALECARMHHGLVGRVISIAGRFAQLPEKADDEITWFLLHGKEDSVTHYGHTIRAAEHLVALGDDVVADVLPFVGHTLDKTITEWVLKRLGNHVPQKTWREALREDGPIFPKLS